MSRASKGLWRLKTEVKVTKYRTREDYEKNKPEEIVIARGNVILKTGMNEMWKLITGNSSNHFDSTNSRIGVGDSNTAEDENQTDLLGSNKAYKALDPGMPLISDNILITESTFYEDEANFSWQEVVLKNNASSICLNRTVHDFGTKSQGNVWPITIRIRFTN